MSRGIYHNHRWYAKDFSCNAEFAKKHYVDPDVGISVGARNVFVWSVSAPSDAGKSMLERGPPTAVGRRGQPDRTFVRPITTM
jgi:hypothetical protein